MLPVFTSDAGVLEEMIRARSRLGGKVLATPPSTPGTDSLLVGRELSFSSDTESPSKMKWKGTAARPTKASIARDVTRPQEGVKGPTVSRERKEEALSRMHAWCDKGTVDLSKKTKNAILKRERVGLYTNSAIRIPNTAWSGSSKVSALQALVDPGENAERMFTTLPLHDEKEAWQVVSPRDLRSLRISTDKDTFFTPDPVGEDPLELVKPIRYHVLIPDEEYTRLSRQTTASKGKAPEDPPDPVPPRRVMQISEEDHSRIARQTVASKGKVRKN
eukprot:TRINITY_DN6116_c0_g1_i3.p2 TRINITY_DN6116_c0_g1~~TRINITY_DN6116_c0_g1_i3.p2  ORF type:complete len:275 (+),score=44.10 TRINITY_DN6116_c0_g1_i3:1128-1952(+)